MSSMTGRFVTAAKAVIEVSREHDNDRCAECSCTRYEHRDHAHMPAVVERRGLARDAAVVRRRVCPFGDCDEFV